MLTPQNFVQGHRIRMKHTYLQYAARPPPYHLQRGPASSKIQLLAFSLRFPPRACADQTAAAFGVAVTLDQITEAKIKGGANNDWVGGAEGCESSVEHVCIHSLMGY